MMKTAIVASSLALFASTAYAADAVTEIPEAPAAEYVAPAFSWEGAYFGIDAGHGWLDGEFSAVGAAGSIGEDFDGASIGAFAGYNWQLSSGFVAGVEGDVSYNFNDNEYLGLADVGTDWAGSVRAKVGYTFDRALIYVAGGWTATNGYVEVDAADFDESETFHGWTLGAGVDYAVTDNMFLRAEYRYNDFGDKDIELAPGAVLNADLDQHVVKVGLGVKF
jgi:outer membrane immunogenic protein